MYLSRVTLRPEIGATQLPELLADRNGYGLHRLFWGLFSDGRGDVQTRNFLFREERAGEQLARPGRRQSAPLYYVLSATRPKTGDPLFMVETKAYEPKLSAGERLAFKLRVNAVVTRDGRRHDIVMDAQKSWLTRQLQALGVEPLGDKRHLKQRLVEHAGEQQLRAWRLLVERGDFNARLQRRLEPKGLLEWVLKTVVAERILEWWVRQGDQRHGFAVAANRAGQLMLEHNAYRKHPLPEKGHNASFNSLDLSGEVVVLDVAKFQELLLQGIGSAKAFGCGLMLVRRS